MNNNSADVYVYGGNQELSLRFSVCAAFNLAVLVENYHEIPYLGQIIFLPVSLNFMKAFKR